METRSGPIEGDVYGGTGRALMAVSFTQLIIAVIVVGLRLYGARKRAGQIKWDFIWVALATVIGIITQVFFVFACINGIGRHLVDITYPELFAALKFSWYGILVGISGTAFAKLAITALLLQVATVQQRKRKIFLWTVAIYSTTVTALQIVISLTQCAPISRLWYVAGPGTCPRAELAANFGYFQGASAAVTDTILALYPISIVWNLQASLRIKVGFCMLMAVGLLCTIASTIRTVYIYKLKNPTDVTTELATFLGWANTELWMVIILGSVPPLRPLFVRWFGTIRSKVTDVSGTRSMTNGGTRLGGTRMESVDMRQASVDVRTLSVDVRQPKPDYAVQVLSKTDGNKPEKGSGEQIMVNYTIETKHEPV